MIDRREHPLSTADLAGGTTARPTDLSEPRDTEMQRGAQDRASEREPRDAGTTVAARPMTEPPMTTPGATTPSASDPATANRGSSRRLTRARCFRQARPRASALAGVKPRPASSTSPATPSSRRMVWSPR